MVYETQIHPLTPDRWDDLETLFGPRGATGGCWCMFWRQTNKEYDTLKGAGNRAQFKAIVDGAKPPGLLAYENDKPIGWIAIAPRKDYTRLERSRVLQPVDDREVWSIVCFFVLRAYRRTGVSQKLIQAAVEFARQNKARIVEAYPIDPKAGKSPDVFVYTGLASSFTKSGFKEVIRRSETRPIMRFEIEAGER